MTSERIYSTLLLVYEFLSNDSPGVGCGLPGGGVYLSEFGG